MIFITFIYIWDSAREKGPSVFIWNVLYENGSCGFHFITLNLNRYIFRNINAIGFLFLTQHTTPLLCVKIHFGVLHMRGTDVTRSDTPYGSKRPHFQVGVSKSVQNRYLCRRVLPLLICSVR